MSQLNQIIASILSDINEAKSKADLASRDLAQIYASDEILRYFPVPKIGISNLEVEIKYAVESVEEKAIESSQSQQRLADFLKNFSRQAAKEIRVAVAKEASSNVLYKNLGPSYPSNEWEENLASNLQDGLSKSLGSGGDLNKNLTLANEQLRKSTADFIPLAFKSDTIAAIPNVTGEYQVVGLNKSTGLDFVVQADFPDEKTAVNVARNLNTAISTNKLELGEVRRDPVSKQDLAKVKIGNQEITLLVESQKVGALQPKVFFENTFKEKSTFLNTPIRNLPTWVAGRPVLTANRPNAPVESPSNLKEDESLKTISQTILQNKLLELRTGIDKILNESKVTSLRLSVESEKLKQLKPENLSSIKFTLIGNDFTMVQDEGQKSIL